MKFNRLVEEGEGLVNATMAETVKNEGEVVKQAEAAEVSAAVAKIKEALLLGEQLWPNQGAHDQMKLLKPLGLVSILLANPLYDHSEDACIQQAVARISASMLARFDGDASHPMYTRFKDMHGMMVAAMTSKDTAESRTQAACIDGEKVFKAIITNDGASYLQIVDATLKYVDALQRQQSTGAPNRLIEKVVLAAKRRLRELAARSPASLSLFETPGPALQKKLADLDYYRSVARQEVC